MIVQAEVTSNSSENKQYRVKIKSDGIWSDTPLIPSVGGLPLNKGNMVYVYCEGNDFTNPLIIGRCMNDSVSYKKDDNGSILWESVDGSSWSICYVMGDKLNIYTSNGLTVKIDGGKMDIDAQTIEISDSTTIKHKGQMKIKGVVAQGLVAGSGPTALQVTGTLMIDGCVYEIER